MCFQMQTYPDVCQEKKGQLKQSLSFFFFKSKSFLFRFQDITKCKVVYLLQTECTKRINKKQLMLTYNKTTTIKEK